MGIPSIASPRAVASSIATEPRADSASTHSLAVATDSSTDSFIAAVTNSIRSLGRSVVSGVLQPGAIEPASEVTVLEDAKALRAFAFDLVGFSFPKT